MDEASREVLSKIIVCSQTLMVTEPVQIHLIHAPLVSLDTHGIVIRIEKLGSWQKVASFLRDTLGQIRANAASASASDPQSHDEEQHQQYDAQTMDVINRVIIQTLRNANEIDGGSTTSFFLFFLFYHPFTCALLTSLQC